MSKKLRSGYTTGTHATALVGAILFDYIHQKTFTNIEVELPDGQKADIAILKEKKRVFSTIKVDNDDLDVTKGCNISLELFLIPPTHIKPQNQSIIRTNSITLHIYAGDGVGVVTKKGLKIAPNFPAINPSPLLMMQTISSKVDTLGKSYEFHLLFSIEDGEEIAKSTANAKVGVIGGLSILGTKGIVKPISATAYIDSIATELSVLEASGAKEVVFTLGNSALDRAKEQYDLLSIIEIGNFVYDALQLLEGKGFTKVIFITSIAKMTKVAQGCKNTHNRFGGIDFDSVDRWLEESNIQRPKERYTTLKGVLEHITESDKFIDLVDKRASQQIQEWLNNKSVSVQIITLYKK